MDENLKEVANEEEKKEAWLNYVNSVNELLTQMNKKGIDANLLKNIISAYNSFIFRSDFVAKSTIISNIIKQHSQH